MLTLTVADAGRGGADTSGGSGLQGLFDRVEAVGGELTLSSPSAGGTRLTARLPLAVHGA
jgi:signal transduction histidine kinase